MSLRRTPSLVMIARPAVAGHVLSAILLTTYLLLATQGLGNTMLAGSGAVIWKQIVVLLCFAAIATALGPEDVLASTIVLAAVVMLCLSTVIAGHTFGKAAYNAFFYVSWLPFYLFGERYDVTPRTKWMASLLIVASAVGLWVEFTTPYLDALKEDDAAIRDLFGYDQRLAFVFSFSTGVMPVLAVFFCLALLAGAGPGLTLALLMWLALCVIPTGSLAAVLMLVACAAMGCTALDGRGRLAALALAVALGGAALLVRTDRTDIQIERILGNDAGSDSNIGRLKLWSDAVEVIGRAGVPQLLFGRGIGATNDDQFGRATFGHGESSFFQAVIEGGIVGLALRLMPLLLLLRASLAHPRRGLLLSFLGGEFVVCCVAPILGTFGVQCGVALVAGAAWRSRQPVAPAVRPDATANGYESRVRGDGSRRRSAA